VDKIAGSSSTKSADKGLHLGRSIRLVWTCAPGWSWVNVALVVVNGVLPLAGPYLYKRLVDAFQVGLTVGGGAASFRPVLFWGALTVAAALLAIPIGALASLAGQAQSFLVSDKVTDIFHRQSAAVDLEYYENANYYNSMRRALGGASSRPISIVNGLLGIGQSAISLVGIVAMLFATNRMLGFVLLLVALPGTFVRTIFARRQYRFEMEQTEKERHASYYDSMLTSSWYAKEVRLFNLATLFQTRFRTLRQQLRGGRLALSRRKLFFNSLTGAFTTLAIYGTMGFIAYQAFRGKVTFGSVAMYYSGLQLAVGSFSGILGALAGLYEDNLFLSNFYQFLALEPKVKAPANPAPTPTRITRGIAFQDVHFAYPSDSRRVLESVSLNILPGQVIALVGANGSGKTTLVKLLCRLYDPDIGRITVDGTDIRRLDPTEWRRRISVILQDYVQYQMTAWENIWLGDVDREPDRGRIVRAAELSGSDSAIRKLPQGYDTPLGYWFQHGRELSGGEWQKVALARAFLRDSELVVLDEPTSSLDPLAEAEVFEHFRRVIRGRSAVLISHRFSTVRMADYIYVLDHGRVVESGSHQDLVDLGGLYARLYSAQASRYQEQPRSDTGSPLTWPSEPPTAVAPPTVGEGRDPES
jgi:ATP-binding cassette subfamily B protein